MTATQKHQAFLAVCAQVRAIEDRKHIAIQEQSHAEASATYAALVAQRDGARKSGGFSLLK